MFEQQHQTNQTPPLYPHVCPKMNPPNLQAARITVPTKPINAAKLKASVTHLAASPGRSLRTSWRISRWSGPDGSIAQLIDFCHPNIQPNLRNAWSYDGGQKTEKEVDGIEDLIRSTWQRTRQKPKDFIILFKLLLSFVAHLRVLA